MKQRLSIFLVLLLAGCAVTTGGKSIMPLIGDAPQKGPANAPVTIVEFLDYT